MSDRTIATRAIHSKYSEAPWAPNNHIAGGGFFVQYSSLPLEMAWDAFGEKHGMPDPGSSAGAG
ncbi:MAG: hypothetical protein IPJ76_14950 [Flavobacteriales bacterium]|nr:MAG: hypothetical protein IPJ76_14950 [Flavobacteriales bacterium]